MSSLLREAVTERDRPAAPESQVPPVMEVIMEERSDPTPDAEVLKPLAIVLVGDPKYLADPAIEGWAMPFYNEVLQLLQTAGYRVEFDYGTPGKHPNRRATVWVAHDSGASRMAYAKPGARKIYLETAAANEVFDSDDQRRRNQAHYRLSDKDVERLSATKLEETSA